MAIEKEAVEQGLTSRGIDTALATTFNFETEEQMNATLDQLKPRTFSSIEDVLKDEKLSAMVRTYGDKRMSDLQSKFDKEKTGKDEKKTDTPDIAAQFAELMNPLKEQIAQLTAQKQTETFANQVKSAATLAGITDEEFINDIKESLPSTATPEEIKAKVEKKKAYLTKLGVKNFGTPGGGEIGNKGDLESAMKEWNKKQDLKKSKK